MRAARRRLSQKHDPPAAPHTPASRTRASTCTNTTRGGTLSTASTHRLFEGEHNCRGGRNPPPGEAMFATGTSLGQAVAYSCDAETLREIMHDATSFRRFRGANCGWSTWRNGWRPVWVSNPQVTFDIAKDVRADVLAPARSVIGDGVASVVLRTRARYAMHDLMTMAQVAQDYFRIEAAHVTAGGVVVDGGANVGMYAVLVALAEPSAVVHTSSPWPLPLRRPGLTRRPTGWQGVRVHMNQLALGNEVAAQNLALTLGGRQGTLCADILNNSKTGATEPVSVVRLDDYCQSVGVDRVDVLSLMSKAGRSMCSKGQRPQTLAHTRTAVMEWHSADRAQRADRLLVQAGLTFVASCSDDPQHAIGIGYWVRQ